MNLLNYKCMVEYEMVSLLLVFFAVLIFKYIIRRNRYYRQLTDYCGEVLVSQMLKSYCKNKTAHILNHITLLLEEVQQPK